MTVTRVVYSDIILGFTATTSTKPSSTDITNIILNLYKKVYWIWYGNLSLYDTNDANISDDSMNAVFPIVQSAASRIANGIYQAMKLDSQQSIPVIDFTKDENFQIAMIKPLNVVIASREEITYYD